MNKAIVLIVAIATLGVSTVSAEDVKADVFKGKLFAPNIILRQRDQLHLTDQQLADIRAAVVAVQSGVAEHEWDMQEAYQALMQEIGRAPIDAAEALKNANRAFLAENQVKAMQIGMLITLKNLLSTEQVAFLEELTQEN